jgi:hypothetical protein
MRSHSHLRFPLGTPSKPASMILVHSSRDIRLFMEAR